MKPTEELVHEHQVITLVLNAVTIEAGKLRNAGKIDPVPVEKMLDFFRNFTDRCHHAKEEKHLFPLIERRGMPRDKNTVGVMLAEHDEGRRLVSNIGGLLPAAARGDREAVLSLSDSLAAYARLLEDHIAKENGVLFPRADQILTPEDQTELQAAFARVEEEETGEGVHEKYHALAHEISALLSE